MSLFKKVDIKELEGATVQSIMSDNREARIGLHTDKGLYEFVGQCSDGHNIDITWFFDGIPALIGGKISQASSVLTKVGDTASAMFTVQSDKGTSAFQFAAGKYETAEFYVAKIV